MLHVGGVGKYMSQIQDGLSIQGIWGSTIWSNAFCISGDQTKGGAFSSFLGAPVLDVKGPKISDQ